MATMGNLSCQRQRHDALLGIQMKVKGDMLSFCFLYFGPGSSNLISFSF